MRKTISRMIICVFVRLSITCISHIVCVGRTLLMIFYVCLSLILSLTPTRCCWFWPFVKCFCRFHRFEYNYVLVARSPTHVYYSVSSHLVSECLVKYTFNSNMTRDERERKMKQKWPSHCAAADFQHFDLLCIVKCLSKIDARRFALESFGPLVWCQYQSIKLYNLIFWPDHDNNHLSRPPSHTHVSDARIGLHFSFWRTWNSDSKLHRTTSPICIRVPRRNANFVYN